MPWIIGSVNKDELERLRKIGWKDEDPPKSLIYEDEVAGKSEDVTRAFFVDTDLFVIMTGKDWEQEKSP